MYQKDIETFDLEDFKYNSVNITAFRLVDVESPKVVDIMEQMKKFQHSGKDMNGSSVIMVKFLFLFSAPLIPNFYIKMAFYFSHCFFLLLLSHIHALTFIAILRIFTQHVTTMRVSLHIFLLNLMTTHRAIQLSCLMQLPCTLMDWPH